MMVKWPIFFSMIVASLLVSCIAFKLSHDNVAKIGSLEVDTKLVLAGVDIGAKLEDLSSPTLYPKEIGAGCGEYRHGDMYMVLNDTRVAVCMFGKEEILLDTLPSSCDEVVDYVDDTEYMFKTPTDTTFNAVCKNHDGLRWFSFDPTDLPMTFTSNKAITVANEVNLETSYKMVKVPHVADSSWTTTVVTLELPVVGSQITTDFTLAKVNGFVGGMDDSAASTNAQSPAENSVTWGTGDSLIYAGGTLGGGCLNSGPVAVNGAVVSMTDKFFYFGLNQHSSSDYEGCDFGGRLLVRL